MAPTVGAGGPAWSGAPRRSMARLSQLTRKRGMPRAVLRRSGCASSHALARRHSLATSRDGYASRQLARCASVSAQRVSGPTVAKSRTAGDAGGEPRLGSAPTTATAPARCSTCTAGSGSRDGDGSGDGSGDCDLLPGLLPTLLPEVLPGLLPWLLPDL